MDHGFVACKAVAVAVITKSLHRLIWLCRGCSPDAMPVAQLLLKMLVLMLITLLIGRGHVQLQ